MKVVFVHGVPETEAVWGSLRAQLDVSSTALALPGFGRGLPDGFIASMDGYAAWLVEQLQRIGEPVDVVGHDWGALLVLRAATLGAVRLRSWTVDVGSVFHPDYVWHPWASRLQRQGEGEQMLRARRESTLEESASLMLESGVPRTIALEMAGALDELMCECILGLYRSAVPNAAARWGGTTANPTSSPGLILAPAQDRVDDEAKSREVAESLGARIEVLDDLNHWWMFDTSGRVAKVLHDFWGGVTDASG